MPTNPACPNDNRPAKPVSRLMLKTARLEIHARVRVLTQLASAANGTAAMTRTNATVIQTPARDRLAAGRESPAAFGWRCMPLGGVARLLDILAQAFGHEAARKENQRHHQQAKRDRTRIGV